MFTADYADRPEIIRAAQVCGARLVKGFFPKWMVDKFAEDGKITVQHKGSAQIYEVSVTDGKDTQTIECNTRYNG